MPPEDETIVEGQQPLDLETNQPESSTGTDAKPESSPGEQEGVAAESSTAEGERPKSSLDAVLKVLGDQRGEAEKAAEAAKEKPPVSEATKPEGEDAKGKPEGEQRQPRHKTAEQRIPELLGEVKSLKPKAQNWDRLQSWVTSTGMSHEEFTQAITIASLMRSDPHKAYELLAPTLEFLREQVGEVLPADLQQEVEDGQITAARAREIASRRNAEANLRRSLDERDQYAIQANEQMRVQGAITAIQQAASDWERAQSTSDPDWSKKASFVADKVAYLIATEGAATTPEEAVKQAARAKEMVDKALKATMPPPKPRTSTTGGAAVQTTGQPKSSLEAARLALGQGARSSA